MRILLTTPTYPPENSGLGNAVQQQASGLVSKGIDVVVATGGERRRQRFDCKTGVLVEEFQVSGSSSLLSPIKGDFHSYLKFLGQEEFDVIIMNAWQTWSSDLILGRLRQFPGKKILYSHCVSTNLFFKREPLRSVVRYLAWRPYWWRVRKYMELLDGVVFLAKQGDDSRFDDLRLACKNDTFVSVVPNSISEAGLKALSEPVRSRDVRSQIISVGSYHWQKGFDFVLKAYAGSQFKNQIPLSFFGQEKTEYTKYLQELAEKLGVSSRYVRFCAGVSGEALIKEYQRACIFICGSYTECQPLVLLDANSTGTPFVARRTGCISSISGGSSVSTHQEASKQIDDILLSQKKWGDLSGKGRAAASLKYHPDYTTNQLLEVINKVVGGDVSVFP
ncbi:glycosyltransferase family 4 protein [Methylophaga sp.]|uniref:glycosyltransferase family 4 protein n=1 Tax=Methylophaga sp. TaxID=2024840 RepID=UPI003A8CB09F